jgi:hypothetical protein
LVLKKQKEDEYIAREIILPTFLPDSRLSYFSKNYTIKIMARDKEEEQQNSIEIVNNNLLVYVEASDIHVDKGVLKNKVRY